MHFEDNRVPEYASVTKRQPFVPRSTVTVFLVELTLTTSAPRA
jgi:hypothetical protein